MMHQSFIESALFLDHPSGPIAPPLSAEGLIVVPFLMVVTLCWLMATTYLIHRDPLEGLYATASSRSSSQRRSRRRTKKTKPAVEGKPQLETIPESSASVVSSSDSVCLDSIE